MSRRYLTAIGLTAMATLMLELTLTRVFSVTMWYHFAFMAISLALFGLSAGAIYLYLWPDRFPEGRLEEQSGRWMLSFAILLPLLFFTMIRVPFDGEISLDSFFQLTLIYILAAIPFLTGGMAISLAFRHRSRWISRLYFADLAGAGIGCGLTLALLSLVPAPQSILIIAAVGALAALLFVWRLPRLKTGAMLTIGALLLLFAVELSLGTGLFQVNRVKGIDESQDRDRVYEAWNSFSRIVGYRITNQELEGWGLSGDPNRPTVAEQVLLLIDGDAATPIALFDGDPSSADYLLEDVTNLVYHLRQDADVLIIGPGGGRDVLAAVASGQGQIDGVELNPLMIEATESFPQLSGGLYQLPQVSITIDEGRNYIARSERKWDIIQSSLVDTWAATSAGAFALSENNLYTVDAFEDYIDHLSEDGIFTMSRWFHGDRPTETLRMTAIALSALERIGVADPPSHLAVLVKPDALIATLLIKRSAFSEAERDTLLSVSEELELLPLQIPGRVAEPPLRDLVYNADRANFWENYPADISPTTDDRPYFFYTLRWDNLDDWRLEQGVSNRNNQGIFVLYSLLIIVFALAVLTILVPMWWKRRTALRGVPGIGRYLLYFAALGLAFLLVEIPLVQRFSLFLGHPIYALAVILFSVLLFSGIGSYLSGQLGGDRPIRTLVRVLPFLLVLLVLYAFYLTPILQALLAQELTVRIIIAIFLIAPLGLLMGMPMPLGIASLGRRQPQLIPWMWGINGATSVVASVLAMVVSLSIGLRATLLVGMGIYALGWFAAMALPKPGPTDARGEDRVLRSESQTLA